MFGAVVSVVLLVMTGGSRATVIATVSTGVVTLLSIYLFRIRGFGSEGK